MPWWEWGGYEAPKEEKPKKVEDSADKKWYDYDAYGQDFGNFYDYSYTTPTVPKPAETIKPASTTTYNIDPWMQQYNIPTPPAPAPKIEPTVYEQTDMWMPSLSIPTTPPPPPVTDVWEGIDWSQTETDDQEQEQEQQTDYIAPHYETYYDAAESDVAADISTQLASIMRGADEVAEAIAAIGTDAMYPQPNMSTYSARSTGQETDDAPALTGTTSTQSVNANEMFALEFVGNNTDVTVYFGQGLAEGIASDAVSMGHNVSNNPVLEWRNGTATALNGVFNGHTGNHEQWLLEQAIHLNEDNEVIAAAKDFEDLLVAFGLSPSAVINYADYDLEDSADLFELQTAFAAQEAERAPYKAQIESLVLFQLGLGNAGLDFNMDADAADDWRADLTLGLGAASDPTATTQEKGFYNEEQWARHTYVPVDTSIIAEDSGVSVVTNKAADSSTHQYADGTIVKLPYADHGDEEWTAVDEDGNPVPGALIQVKGREISFFMSPDIDKEVNYNTPAGWNAQFDEAGNHIGDQYTNVRVTWNPVSGHFKFTSIGALSENPKDDGGSGPQLDDAGNPVNEHDWYTFVDDAGDEVLAPYLADFIYKMGPSVGFSPEQIKAMVFNLDESGKRVDFKIGPDLVKSAKHLAGAWINMQVQSGVGNLQAEDAPFFNETELAIWLAGNTPTLGATDVETAADVETADGTDAGTGTKNTVKADTVRGGTVATGSLGFKDTGQEGGEGAYLPTGPLFDAFRNQSSEYGFAGDPNDLMVAGASADGMSFFDQPFDIQEAFYQKAGYDLYASEVGQEDAIAAAQQAWAQERNAYALGVVPERTVQDSEGNDVQQYWMRGGFQGIPTDDGYNWGGGGWMTGEQIMDQLERAGAVLTPNMTKAQMIQMFNNADPQYAGDYMVTTGWLEGDTGGGDEYYDGGDGGHAGGDDTAESVGNAADGWLTDTANFYDAIKDLEGAPSNQFNELYKALMPYLTFADASGLADLLRQNGVTDGMVLPDDTAFFHDAADFQTTTRFDAILGALDGLELQGIVVNQAHSWLKQWVETLREFAIDPESGQNWLPSAERSSLSKRLSDLWAWAQSDLATFGAVTGIASKLALPYQSEGYFNLYWGQQANPALM